MSPSIAHATGRPTHDVAVVLGSGLGELARSLVGESSIPYSQLDGMPTPTAGSHQGALYSGEVEGIPTLVFAGRAHLYEGHDVRTVTAGVRNAVAAGCKVIVLTNAAGGIDPNFSVGEPVLISDHLNLQGTNPLFGHADPATRFLDLSEVYDKELRALARSVDPSLKEGVYAALTGPVYETPAEIRMLAAMGADVVGMSTVQEAIEARYLGARVLAVSVVTNAAAGLSDKHLEHGEVSAAGRAAGPRLENLIRGVIGGLR